MPITNHAAYIRDVERSVRQSETSWSWTDPADIPEEEIEVSDAAIAVAVYLDSVDPGPAGIITLPDGQALAWHADECWEHLDAYGDATPLDLAVDAAPAEVAAVARHL